MQVGISSPFFSTFASTFSFFFPPSPPARPTCVYIEEIEIELAFVVLKTTSQMRPRMLGTPEVVNEFCSGRYCGGILFCNVQYGEQK